jgi:hypothetical protein
MKLLRLAGLVSLFAVCSMLMPFAGLETARAASDYYGCWTDCCERGVSAGGFGSTVDEAYQNLSCEGHGGVCGPIECDPISN